MAGRVITSVGEDPDVFCDATDSILYYQTETPPWTALSRELVYALCPGADAGSTAMALSQILSALSITEAERSLDDAGFARLSKAAPQNAKPSVALTVEAADQVAEEEDVDAQQPSVDIQSEITESSLSNSATPPSISLKTEPPAVTASGDTPTMPAHAPHVPCETEEDKPSAPRNSSTPTQAPLTDGIEVSDTQVADNGETSLQHATSPDRAGPSTSNAPSTVSPEQTDRQIEQEGSHSSDHSDSGRTQPQQSGGAGAAPRPAGPHSSPSGSNGTGPKKAQSSQNKSQERRMRSYVYVSGGKDENDKAMEDSRSKVGMAGVLRVIDSEKQAGRVPQEMPFTNAGYDIQSANMRGQAERYIEVKSISTYWGDTGVALTPAEFELAREFGEKYWIYVVENAVDDDNFTIFRIQNPAHNIYRYMFDRGWHKFASENDEGEGP